MKIEGFFFIKFNYFNLNISFNFDKLKILVIIGESGSGKTTFLKCLSGLLKPTYGFLKIGKSVFQDNKINKFLHPNCRNIGHVLQQNVLFDNLSPLNNITLGFNDINTNYISLKTVINTLNISKLMKRSIKNLSSGEKQRLSIAQILLTQPKIILLDESFSFQDVKSKLFLINFFKKINFYYNVPIIYVCHNMDDIENFATHIFYMKNGKLLINNTNI